MSKKQDKRFRRVKLSNHHGVYESNQTNFQEISIRFNKTLTPEITLIVLPEGLYSILAGNYWAATLIPEISDPVYKVNK